jgi:hypothetical protein
MKGKGDSSVAFAFHLNEHLPKNFAAKMGAENRAHRSM